MIKGSIEHAVERVSIRNVLRGTDSMAPRNRPQRRTKALVGWLLYCCTAVGGTAAAFTVRETLFPSLGAPTERSLWVSPKTSEVPKTSPTSLTRATDASGSTEAGELSAIEAGFEATSVTTPQSTLEGQTASSASLPGKGPNNTVDNHGPGGGEGPETGTTVAATPSNPSGPGSGNAGKPATPGTSGTSATPGSTATSGTSETSGTGSTVTTVGSNPSQPTTPSSSSNPADPPTSASTPAPVTTDDHQSGKGGGGGGSDTSLP